MRFNINFKQIILLILIFFFLFGDFFHLKQKIQKLYNYLVNFVKKNK